MKEKTSSITWSEYGCGIVARTSRTSALTSDVFMRGLPNGEKRWRWLLLWRLRGVEGRHAFAPSHSNGGSGLLVILNDILKVLRITTVTFSMWE